MAIKYSATLTSGLTDITGGGVKVAGTYLLTAVHRGQDVASLSVAVTSGKEPTDADWIEWRARLKTSDVLSRHPIPLGVGGRVYASASAEGVSITLIGREE